MSCSHTAACPLFPLLNASLEGWRRSYCDSDDGWLDCARYKRSVTGSVVPLGLLPNGSRAAHLQERAAPPAVAAPADVRGQDGGTAAAGYLFEQEGRPAGHAGAAPERGAPQPLPDAATPGYLPSGRTSLPGPAPRAPGGRWRWWARLVDWLGSPA